MEHRADADALALVRRFVTRCHPDAEAALLAGSRSRGRGAPGSDYDVILLFGELPNGAWRKTSAFEEQVIETFAHDRGTLGYRSRCDRWSARRQTVLHAPAAAEQRGRDAMPWSTLTSPGGPCSILAPLAAQSSGRSGLFRSMTVRSTALSSTKANRTSLLTLARPIPNAPPSAASTLN